jgi:rhodanese-related sulfurtransferase
MIKEITPLTLKEWMDDTDVILIDVREIYEYEDEYIEGALHVPLAALTFQELPLEGKRRIVFQCRSGKRSLYACDKILDDIEDNMELYSLTGGIIAWKDAGFPVKSGMK